MTVVLIKKEVGEGGNGGVFPEVGKVGVSAQSRHQMHVALVRFTLIDEPDPPLT